MVATDNGAGPAVDGDPLAAAQVGHATVGRRALELSTCVRRADLAGTHVGVLDIRPAVAHVAQVVVSRGARAVRVDDPAVLAAHVPHLERKDWGALIHSSPPWSWPALREAASSGSEGC